MWGGRGVYLVYRFSLAGVVALLHGVGRGTEVGKAGTC